MDEFDRLLKKFSEKEKLVIKDILQQLKTGRRLGLHIEKLSGYANLFRVKKSRIRIVYTIDERNKINIIRIERRSEKTYRNL